MTARRTTSAGHCADMSLGGATDGRKYTSIIYTRSGNLLSEAISAWIAECRRYRDGLACRPLGLRRRDHS
jgi:hypothetical protein